MANTEATVHVEMSPEFRARLTDLGEQLRRMQESLDEVEMRQGVAEAAHHLLVKGLALHLERFKGAGTLSADYETSVPIEPTPGDLLMITRAAVAQLENIRDTSPDDSLAFEAIAVTTMASIGYWLSIRSPGVADPASVDAPG